MWSTKYVHSQTFFDHTPAIRPDPSPSPCTVDCPFRWIFGQPAIELTSSVLVCWCLLVACARGMLLRVVLLILKITTLIVEQSMPQKYVDMSEARTLRSPTPEILSPLSSSCASSSLQDKNDGGGGGPTEHCHFPALVIPCQWENYQGILTAGVRGLVFTGSFFLFDTILSMPWTDVRRMHFAVVLVDAADQPSLVVTMRKTRNQERGELPQLQHVFARVPPTHLSRLMHLQNEALTSSSRRHVVGSYVVAGGGTMTTANTVTSSGGSTLLLLDDDDEDDDVNEDDDTTTAATATDCRSTTTVVTTTSVTTTSLWAERMPDYSIVESHTGLPLSIRDINVSHDDTKGRLYTGPKGLVVTGRRFFWDYTVVILPWSAIWKIHRPAAQTVLVQSHDMRDYTLVVTDSSTTAVDGIWETLISCHNMQLTQITPAGAKKKPHHHPPSSVQDARPETIEAITVPENTFSPLRHVVVSNVELPCSLQQFEDLFLRDQALYSLAHFLTSRGDSELETSNWDDDSARVVRYLHPVNVPMAPPQAHARKEQRLVRRQRQQQQSPNSADDGDDANTIVLIVETKTIVDDVPMTDCFYVLDRLTVTQQEQQQPPVAVGGKKITTTTTATIVTVQVRMEFEITFVKSTMFQGIIRQTTNREFTTMFQSLVDYYIQCLVVVDPATTSITTTSSEPPVQLDHKTNGRRRSSSYGVAPLCYYLLWGVTFALQLWILRELREIKAALRPGGA
jgi:VAD1 Analog of StAR-related lipid transfer domain